MIDGIQLKVCGLRSLVDADAADGAGADFLGFNFYPPSPRALSLVQYRAMVPQLPPRRRVAVAVEPSAELLAELEAAGFDAVQIHFRTAVGPERLAEWSRAVGPARLWLAPKLPPEEEIPAGWLPLARIWLLDTYQPALFGGSGRVGDWSKFARYQAAHPEVAWVLAGGLNAENIGAALSSSGARLVDVNSGIESAPGVKDPAKLTAFVAALRAARRAGAGSPPA